MLERELPWLLEEDVDDDSLRRCQDDGVDELLALMAAACHRRRAFIRAPGKATLNTRVFAVFVR